MVQVTELSVATGSRSLTAIQTDVLPTNRFSACGHQSTKTDHVACQQCKHITMMESPVGIILSPLRCVAGEASLPLCTHFLQSMVPGNSERLTQAPELAVATAAVGAVVADPAALL